MRRAAIIVGQGLGVLVVVLGLALGLQIWRNSGDAELPEPAEGTLRIAGYNVHYIRMRAAEGPWSVGDWQVRRGPLDAAFKTLDADLVAFQEMESFGGGRASDENLARDWLLERNPGYAVAAAGDPAEFPSTQPILYRTDRLRQADQGWFFFSETPDVLYSRTFDGSYPAFASWAAFEDRNTGAGFRVVNIHFDYASGENRLRSSALVRDRISGWIDAGESVILMGDTNALEGRPTMEILEEAGLEFTDVSGATYHFDRGLNLFGAIDHIALSGEAELAAGPFVLRRRFEGEWPTDHYPVVADIRLSP
ncbi:exonuclease/endonuclease/phosphatase family protein [Histidinibacterium aquaticum]|uniref:Endonuclease n=1 Tax=Histidinibacterium aquaticum TaxID=2613962 RepID=A0A5J5GIT6_9RHOB|nr:endonuclease [Histidinibacterium aquaticum]KAA9008146.1 endonuclease [Histidinibacterium aquaticum]